MNARVKSILLKLVGGILRIYLALLVVAGFFSNYFIFPVPKPSYIDDSRIMKLTTSDGLKISARYERHPKSEYTILYSHGNGEDLGDGERIDAALYGAGFSVLSYDFHGYGTSEGKPSETNVYRDIDAAYDYLTRVLAIPHEKIIAVGHSLGAAVTIDLASRKPLGGVILMSPFLTSFRVATGIPLVPFDRFRNQDKISRIHCPILVIHGEADRVIGCWHGKRLFELANECKKAIWVPRAGHNDLLEVAGEEFEKWIRDFTRECGRAAEHRPVAEWRTGKEDGIDVCRPDSFSTALNLHAF